MKKYSTVLVCIISLLALPLFTGCQSTGGLSPASLGVLKPAVQFATQETLRQNPEYVSVARLAGNVICTAAGTTNLSPEALNAVLVQANPALFDNPVTSLLGNTVISLYTAQYAQWVNAKVSSYAYLQASLQVMCDGITAGLPAAVNSVPNKTVSAPAAAAVIGWSNGYKPGK